MSKIAVLLWLAWFYSLNAVADDRDISIDIKTGNINILAIGDKASASINIGGLLQTQQPSCTRIHVEHGNVRRTAIGNNANANIQLLVNQKTCEDKQYENP